MVEILTVVRDIVVIVATATATYKAILEIKNLKRPPKKKRR